MSSKQLCSERQVSDQRRFISVSSSKKCLANFHVGGAAGRNTRNSKIPRDGRSAAGGSTARERRRVAERTLRKITEIAMQSWPRSEARAKGRRMRSARQYGRQYG
jgi:hypothetical protein